MAIWQPCLEDVDGVVVVHDVVDGLVAKRGDLDAVEHLVDGGQHVGSEVGDETAACKVQTVY